MKRNYTPEENTRVMKVFSELLEEISRAKNESRVMLSAEGNDAAVAAAVAEFEQIQNDATKVPETIPGLTQEQSNAAAAKRVEIVKAAVKATDAIVRGDLDESAKALDNLATAGRETSGSRERDVAGKNPETNNRPQLVAIEARSFNQEDGNPYENVDWQFIPGDPKKNGLASKHQVRGRVLFGKQEVAIAATVAHDKRAVDHVSAPRLQFIPGHIPRVRDAINEWIGTRTEDEWQELTGEKAVES